MVVSGADGDAWSAVAQEHHLAHELSVASGGHGDCGAVGEENEVTPGAGGSEDLQVRPQAAFDAAGQAAPRRADTPATAAGPRRAVALEGVLRPHAAADSAAVVRPARAGAQGPDLASMAKAKDSLSLLQRRSRSGSPALEAVLEEGEEK